MSENNSNKNSYSSLTGFHRAMPIILFALAVFIGLCFIMQDIGALGHAISGLLLGLFSYGAYLIPFLIALHAFFYPHDLAAKTLLSRFIFSTIALLALSAMAYCIDSWGEELTFSAGEFYRGGKELKGGGFLGGMLGFALIKIFGSVGLIIIAVAIFALYISFFFASGKRATSRFFIKLLKGIIAICDTVERGVKRIFGAFRGLKKNKKKKQDSKKLSELTDDEFFAVDNSMQRLEISELGILETRDGKAIEARPPLHDKVHFKSSVDKTYVTESTSENNTQTYSAAYTEADDRTAQRKKFVDNSYGIDENGFIESVEYHDSTSDIVVDYNENVKAKEDNADSFFASDFDPFRLADCENLANKPSSKAEKEPLEPKRVTLNENISELTEEDVKRAKAREDFERRKAAIIASRRAEAVPTKSGSELDGTPKSIDFHETSGENIKSYGEEDNSFSLKIEKNEQADKPTPEPTDDPYVRVEEANVTFEKKISYGTESKENVVGQSFEMNFGKPEEPANEFNHTVKPAFESAQPTSSLDNYAGNISRQEAYRRAAGFAAATEIKTENSNEKLYQKPASSGYSQSYQAAQVTESTYSAPENSFRDNSYSSSESFTVINKREEAPKESMQFVPSYFSVEAKEEPSFQEEIPEERTHESSTTYFSLESSEPSVSVPLEENLGMPEFKPYTPPVAEDTVSGGLTFDIEGEEDNEEAPVLETERTTLYSPELDEDEEEESEEITKPEDEEFDDEEIPPEEQNPVVISQRAMFTALREQDAGKTAISSEQAETVETVEREVLEDEENNPPFDTDDGDIPEDIADLVTEVPEAPKPKKKKDYSNYQFPPIDLLGLDYDRADDEISAEIQENTRILIETLESFNVTASIKGVDRGPRITRYEVVPARGVKVKEITGRFEDIKLNLAAEGVRMEAPIPGKSAIGFEIPNKHPATVRLRELIETDEFASAKSKTFVSIGKDVAGNPIFGDICKYPHALICGATGMGKSVCINSIMISMLYKARPDEVKFIMIDPKKVEFRMYSGIPHLLIPVITEAKQAAGALMWAVEEMERRYDLIEKNNVRNLEAYNEKVSFDPSIGEPLPKIVIVIDELADLMMQVRDPAEDLIMRIAQKARAAGIHLLIGTQRPSVQVITGGIKANIPSRISCKVTSGVDSRTIFDMIGAEKLLNRGDMLYWPVDRTAPLRVQGAFVTDREVETIMEFLKRDPDGSQYDDEVMTLINKAAQKCGNKKGGAAADDDDGDDGEQVGYYSDQRFLDAVELAIRGGKVSTSLLQRKLSIGYGKAAKYIDHMEEIGVVSEPNGQRPRDVLIDMDEWHEKLSRVDLG